MKSIVQEGSTISKAVESAWQSAGKPHEFTVKILEEPQHNFIGMTTRSAKVALFFKEPISSGKSHDKAERFGRQERAERSERPERGERSERDNRGRAKKQGRGPRQETNGKPSSYAKDFRNAQEEQPSWPKERERAPQRAHSKPSFEQKEQALEHEGSEDMAFDGVFWTPEMIIMAKDWLQGSLAAMDLPHVHYSTDVNRLYFKVSFDEPVNPNMATERQIFRSFAMLLMQHMRNRLKRPLKGFKVVLSRGGVDVEDE
ncbi:MAG: hypothetical protein AB7F19_04340 [Candidatus Babeliales bacterium]